MPPQGAAVGAKRVDYLEMSGIHRSVRLTAVPVAYVADEFAKPVKVLDSERRVDVACTIDAAGAVKGDVQVAVELRDGTAVRSRAVQPARIGKAGARQSVCARAGRRVGGVWLRTQTRSVGLIEVTARHSSLGSRSVRINVTRAV